MYDRYYQQRDNQHMLITTSVKFIYGSNTDAAPPNVLIVPNRAGFFFYDSITR